MKSRLLLPCLFILLSSFSLFAQTGNSALLLDGTDDYVSIPDNDALTPQTFTIEMWMYWNNTTNGADVDFLIGKKYEQLEIHTGGGSGDHGLRFIPVSGLFLDTPPYAFTSSCWNHIAFVYDPAQSKAEAYINGTPVTLTNVNGTSLATPMTNTTETLMIGKRNHTSPMYFQGMLDEVRLWNTARTQAEITANMHKQLTGSEEGLAAYYNMNSVSGSILPEASNPLLNGTLNNHAQLVSTDLVLPVELVSFSAAATGRGVELNWQTATEVNNHGFEIERAEIYEGRNHSNNWCSIGFVAGSGNTNNARSYSFLDKFPASGKVMYRLKQIDSDGGFIYSTEIPVSVSAPMEFALLQNYPNPFNPATTIKYSLPEDSYVKLEVYSTLGEKLFTLADEVKSAGNYEAVFDGSTFTSGVYIYKLTAVAAGTGIPHTRSSKMMLVK
ncbi:MAG: LamG-like jellyroll fold domain-containing protein [Bacteroidota bacterium]